MNNLFEEHNDELIENFGIIFDRATNESMAKSNALDYYLCLLDENQCVDIDSIIDLAETYGYDFDNFKKLVKDNM